MDIGCHRKPRSLFKSVIKLILNMFKIQYSILPIYIIIVIIGFIVPGCKNSFSVKNSDNQKLTHSKYNMKHQISFYTEYHQFYLVDKGIAQNTYSDKFWTDEASSDRLAVEEGVLGVSTECYGPVKAEIRVLKSINQNPEIAKADHVVEAGIQIKSGTIQILDCPTSTIQLELNVEPGDYMVRVYSMNLASVDGDEGDDYYILEIWPNKNEERKVLKRWNMPTSG